MERSSFKRASVPIRDMEAPSSSVITKWIPFLCAGAAVGVSIIALNELKNVRKELILMKRENFNGSEFTNRMENMENQLKILADFVQNRDKVSKESNIIKNVVLESQQENIHIINDEEYEEIEVTDDETE
jgi:hypothetical protein